MVQAFIRKEDGVFDEDSAGSQDEREEEVDVDVVPGAVKLPAEDRAPDGQTVWGAGPTEGNAHLLQKRAHLKTVKTKMATMRETREVA